MRAHSRKPTTRPRTVGRYMKLWSNSQVFKMSSPSFSLERVQPREVCHPPLPARHRSCAHSDGTQRETHAGLGLGDENIRGAFSANLVCTTAQASHQALAAQTSNVSSAIQRFSAVCVAGSALISNP